MKKLLNFGMIVAAASVAVAANTITVDAAKVRCPCAPDLWGIFFEDLDLSLDGGIYAELVRNRSFEDAGGKAPDAQKYWLAGGGAQLAVTGDKPHSKINAHSLKVVAPAGGSVANEGYFGMAVRPGVDYRLSVDLRGNPGKLQVALETPEGKSVATGAELEIKGDDWSTCQATLQGLAKCGNARLVFRSEKGGTFYLDCVTLMPSDTYGKSGIFRKDLMEKLAALKPAFMRFPGGGWIRGETMATAYRWKETIGPIWDRRTQWNLWGYWSTHGVGYHEYLLMCEELHAKPLFCINPGVAMKGFVPMEKMDEIVQDALDCIEYANGPVTSKWGAMRAAAGHPAPFNLEYLQLGNEENSGNVYAERYERIAKAVRAKYPDIKIIYCYWRPTRDLKGPRDIRDDHIYASPDWCWSNWDRFLDPAKYDRAELGDGGIFLGEYAVLMNVGKYGDLRSAMAEAALMTGMEYASDVVKLAAYAPLFCHVDHIHWSPNLIYHSCESSFNHPSYEVQRLFAENRGREVLTTTVESEALDPAHRDRVFGLGSWTGAAAFKDFKLVDAGGKVLYENSFATPESLKGWSAGKGDWKIQDGALLQSTVPEKMGALTFMLDRKWQGDLTCTFKAKRVDGKEGFLALYGDSPHNWVNFGGCENQVHVIEGICGGRLDALPRHLATPWDVGRGDLRPRVEKLKEGIEKDRWYDVKLEFQSGALIASLDGRRVLVGNNVKARNALVANALTSPDGKEVIVKVVNYAERPIAAEVVVANAKLAADARLTTYTGPGPNARNSFENPDGMVPVTTPVAVKDGRLSRVFPGLSLSVIRIPRDGKCVLPKMK